MEKFFAQLVITSPDQAEPMHACFSYMREHLQSVPPSEHHEFAEWCRHYLSLRNRMANTYVCMMKRPYWTCEEVTYISRLFRDITEETFGGVKAELFRRKQSPVKIDEHKPGSNAEIPLSKSERRNY